MTRTKRDFEALLAIVKEDGSLSRDELDDVRRELSSPTSSADPYTLLHILGKANDEASLPVVRDYLNFGVGDPDDDGMVRRVAVQILANWWHKKDSFRIVREMAFEDPSPFVRAVAASALGKLASIYPEFQQEAAQCLLRGISQYGDEQSDVWGSFYIGMLELVRFDPRAWPLRPGELKPDDLDRAVLNEIQEMAETK